MDLWKAVAELHRERQRLSRIITALEELQNEPDTSSGRRGRKSMSADERRRVSERMRAWWATRKSPAVEQGQKGRGDLAAAG